MAVGFTDQRISAHAGTAAFWGWLHPSGFVDLLQRVLPHRAARSNNHLTAREKALAFLQGILCEARRKRSTGLSASATKVLSALCGDGEIPQRRSPTRRCRPTGTCIPGNPPA